MRKHSIFTFGVLLPLAAGIGALLFGGCSSTRHDEEIAEARGAVMRFGTTEIASRATLYDKEALLRDGAAFAVWGAMYASGDASQETVTPIPVFDATSVVYNGADAAWGYAGTPQYWFPGFTYNFRALFPAAIDSKPLGAMLRNSERGDAMYVTLEDFDLMQGVDLLGAATEPYVCGYGGRWPTVGGVTAFRVNLSFQHLLCGIAVTGEGDAALGAGERVVIESLKIYGMSSRGSWSGEGFGTAQAPAGRWTPSPEYPTDEDHPYAELAGPVALAAGETHDFMAAGDMLLMMPQMLAEEFVIEVSYRYEGEGAPEDIYVVRVPFSAAPLAAGWQAGHKYRYRFTVGGGDHILLDTPVITPWIDGDDANVDIQ